VIVLSVIGGILLLALIIGGIIFYKRNLQMEALQRELAESQSNQADREPLTAN
jgi:hypothetical protein